MNRTVAVMSCLLITTWVAEGSLRVDIPAVAGQSVRQVVLTFDDLPMTGERACDGDHVREVTRKLTGILEARALPSAGLVTPGRACIGPALLAETLQRWNEVGAVIGNHTATHPDLNSTGVSDYIANVARAQALIDRAVVADGRWFRAPYLHSGDEPTKKRALSEYLVENRYRVAPVLSMDVFGREIPQVLLLHANLLNAELLDRVVKGLENRGYRFTGLPKALSDAAYEREDTYVGPRGLSWLQRWALEDGVPIPAEPREAEWVADAFRAMQQRAP